MKYILQAETLIDGKRFKTNKFRVEELTPKAIKAFKRWSAEQFALAEKREQAIDAVMTKLFGQTGAR